MGNRQLRGQGHAKVRETGFLGRSAREAPWSAGACYRFGVPGGAPVAGSVLPATKAAASLPHAMVMHATLTKPQTPGRHLLTKAGAFVYHIVTMLRSSCHPVFRLVANLFSVAQPVLAVSQKPVCNPVATMHPDTILRDLYLGIAQVPVTSEPENEPEQSVGNTWLTEAKKTKLSNLLKTNDRASARFFVENEAEHIAENKQHERTLTRSEPKRS
jgi:hypothetical protein